MPMSMHIKLPAYLPLHLQTYLATCLAVPAYPSVSDRSSHLSIYRPIDL